MIDPVVPSFAIKSDMVMEDQRKNSFVDWVFSEKNNCSASKLAEAGFYFIGNDTEPDAVCCFFCQKALDQWDADDNPWAEHIKHAPFCQFAKNRKPQRDYEPKEYLEIVKTCVKNVIHRRYDDLKTRYQCEYQRLKKGAK